MSCLGQPYFPKIGYVAVLYGHRSIGNSRHHEILDGFGHGGTCLTRTDNIDVSHLSQIIMMSRYGQSIPFCLQNPLDSRRRLNGRDSSIEDLNGISLH